MKKVLVMKQFKTIWYYGCMKVRALFLIAATLKKLLFAYFFNPLVHNLSFGTLFWTKACDLKTISGSTSPLTPQSTPRRPTRFPTSAPRTATTLSTNPTTRTRFLTTPCTGFCHPMICNIPSSRWCRRIVCFSNGGLSVKDSDLTTNNIRLISSTSKTTYIKIIFF